MDTNALSAFANGDERLREMVELADEVAVPVIVLGEYRYGIRQSRSRKRYEEWLAELIANCRVLLVDEETAYRYAEVRTELKRLGKPIPGNDVWIAALALQHVLPLISRDGHFDIVPGLRRVRW